MKHFILSSLLLLTILSYNLTAQQISSQEFINEHIKEDFNNSNESFEVLTTTDNYFILDRGDYLLSRNNKESEYAIIARNSIVSDFILKTEIRIGPSENKKASIGVILKAQADGNGAIIFEINKKREYRIKQLVVDKYQNISQQNRKEGWIKNKLINGIDENNSIEIRSENNLYDIYINDTYLTTFSVPELSSGSCGLIISPATKARVSFYHINTKQQHSVTNTLKEQDNQNTSSNIENSNERIKIINDKNAQLNELNKKIENLNNIVSALELENKNMSKLSGEVEDLNNIISALEKENKNIPKLNQVNVNQQKSLKEKTEEITELNQTINSKKNEISNLNKQNTELLSTSSKQEKQIKILQHSVKDLRVAENEASKNNNELNQTISKLEQQIRTQKSANTQLIKKLEKANNELDRLQNTQEKHDKVTKNLNSRIQNLNNNNNLLTTELKNANDKNIILENTNQHLKKLFVEKDFELNGVKKSEINNIANNTPSVTKNLLGSKSIYTVQFGVYLKEQDYNEIKNIGNIWYNTTEQGTYVYYSGEFQVADEAAAHKNDLISKGFKNAFVVTINK